MICEKCGKRTVLLKSKVRNGSWAKWSRLEHNLCVECITDNPDTIQTTETERKKAKKLLSKMYYDAIQKVKDFPDGEWVDGERFPKKELEITIFEVGPGICPNKSCPRHKAAIFNEISEWDTTKKGYSHKEPYNLYYECQTCRKMFTKDNQEIIKKGKGNKKHVK